MRLAAAGEVKGATVQGDLPQGSPLTPGNFADVGDVGFEGGQRWISVVEPVRHPARYSIYEHRAARAGARGWEILGWHFSESGSTFLMR